MNASTVVRASARVILVMMGAIWIFIAALAILAIYDHYFGECSRAPKEVPFHQGMTLCPGQSAVFKLQ